MARVGLPVGQPRLGSVDRCATVRPRHCRQNHHHRRGGSMVVVETDPARGMALWKPTVPGPPGPATTNLACGRDGPLWIGIVAVEGAGVAAVVVAVYAVVGKERQRMSTTV